LLDDTYGLIAWWSNAVCHTEVVDASVFNHSLDVLNLNISIKWHIWHHNSNILRCDITITIKIVPIFTIDSFE
jgi:hypothetical protein